MHMFDYNTWFPIDNDKLLEISIQSVIPFCAERHFLSDKYLLQKCIYSMIWHYIRKKEFTISLQHLYKGIISIKSFLFYNISTFHLSNIAINRKKKFPQFFIPYIQSLEIKTLNVNYEGINNVYETWIP